MAEAALPEREPHPGAYDGLGALLEALAGEVWAEAYIGWLNELAISMGGTCTGEHGVGQGKRAYLPRELGQATDVMVAIKAAIDPKGIMNPGKILT